MSSSTRNRSHARRDRRTGELARQPEPSFEVEWNWPRAPLSEVTCETRDFRSVGDSIRSGVATGVGRAFDLAGVLPFEFFRHVPYDDDVSALINDWSIVRGDLVIAHGRLRKELVQRWPEANWPDPQGTLFDPDAIET